MSKLVIAGLAAALLFGASAPSNAQAPSAGGIPGGLTDAVSKAVIERRIDVLKTTLGLTSEQARYWPAVEEAIRGRLTARHQRLARMAVRHNETTEVNLIDLMNRRASNLTERAAALTKLADAWKPLYDSLDAHQKDRLRFLAAYVLREMRDAVEAQRVQSEDQEDEDEDEYYGDVPQRFGGDTLPKLFTPSAPQVMIFHASRHRSDQQSGQGLVMFLHIIGRSLIVLLLLIPGVATAQAPSNPGTATNDQLLKPEQLEALVSPIALYPDSLLSNVLMASTYPLEIVQAERWLTRNKNLSGDALKAAADKQKWDDSVKAMIVTPPVLAMMNSELEWTQKLGDAVLAQQNDVMDAIQRLRLKAQDNGKLTTTPEQKVTVEQQDNRPSRGDRTDQ